MLPFRLTQRSLHRLTTKSILRTPPKRFYSTPGTQNAPSKPIISTGVKNFFLAVGSGYAVGYTIQHISELDSVPHLSSPPTSALNTSPGPSKEEITALLSKDSYSYKPYKISGVTRYDGTQLASNSACEDRYTHGKFPSPSGDNTQWMAWGVFDGHAGWQTAERLKTQLLSFVQNSLGQLQPTTTSNPISNVPEIHKAITQAFLQLDDLIIQTAEETITSNLSLPEKARRLALGYAGSCALLSLYDPTTQTLHVSCTGDSRAILGQQNTSGKWETHALSTDQTGSTPSEIARINALHPSEKTIAKEGRILGLMCSRAFGDGRWKWSLPLQTTLKESYNGPNPLSPRYDIKTPPYITAEPVTTTTIIDSKKPSFLILATDGLWDTISSEQAVDLVSKWLEKYQKNSTSNSTLNISTQSKKYPPFNFQDIEKGVVNEKFEEERMIVQDKNCAVHLLRNSMGGNHHELVAARVAFGAPFSRNVQDDVTVQVVFFNVPGL